uniref:BHLH domain-containing protein n=1 Tax=Kalanchoe fedtschenkoi TaxID=63787 RepID=A0A7N0V039_KALFE
MVIKLFMTSPPGVLFIDTAPKLKPVVPLNKQQTRATSFPGSSTGSSPPNEKNPLTDSSLGHLMHHCLAIHPVQKSQSFCAGLEKKRKNLEVERRRRSRIKGGEFQLRALVPNISKVNKPLTRAATALKVCLYRASIIGDAITDITEQEKTVQELKKEDDENADPSSCKQKTRIKLKQGLPDAGEILEMQVEVHRMCGSNFFFRIVAEFSRQMKAMSSLGLHVEDANITTCHGLVLCYFRAEVNRIKDPASMQKLKFCDYSQK